jgi:hypothetical protein
MQLTFRHQQIPLPWRDASNKEAGWFAHAVIQERKVMPRSRFKNDKGVYLTSISHRAFSGTVRVRLTVCNTICVE